jgi:RNA polymerase sigma-70 factor (ECF subfamily)
MTDAENASNRTQQLLIQAAAGDDAAVDALLRHSCDRLTRLCRRMLGDYPRVRRWAETADVLQSALLRLLNALRSARPATPRDFLALAALQIRRELIDLARQFYGPEGIGANHASGGHDGLRLEERIPGRDDAASLAQWRELHEQIEALPPEEREVVGLLFYQGLSQAEAAQVLNTSVRTVQRRWHLALCKLHRVWHGERPGNV